VFSEPWQAQVFALAVRLGEAGYFTWKEWSEYLALELKAASDRRERDDGSRYYHHWLAALEQIVSAKGLSSLAEMSLRKDAWTDAYLHTPHGHPVELSSAHPHEPTPTGSDD
jgi:nitrile hydratase accessory protein